jgi:hypothetical protein
MSIEYAGWGYPLWSFRRFKHAPGLSWDSRSFSYTSGWVLCIGPFVVTYER